MTSPLLGFTAAIVRAWTRVYTWSLAPNVRDARRAEIESDLWEQLHAPSAGPALPFEILGRLLLGIPDDIHWRLENAWPREAQSRQILLATVATVLLLATMWFLVIARGSEVPPVPPALTVRWQTNVKMPAPPPPPPPICSPAVPHSSPCTPWP